MLASQKTWIEITFIHGHRTVCAMQPTCSANSSEATLTCSQPWIQAVREGVAFASNRIAAQRVLLHGLRHLFVFLLRGEGILSLQTVSGDV